MKITTLLMALAMTVLFSCSNEPKGSSDGKEKKEMTGDTAKAATAEVKYQCTMKCEGDKTYAEAGKCPKCGMEMAAVK